MDVLIRARSEVASLHQNIRVRRNREFKAVLSSELIERAWEIFRNLDNPERLDRFLTAASHILDSFGKDLLFADINQIEDVFNINNYDDVVEMFFPHIHTYIIEDQVVIHRTGCLVCGCKFLATRMTLPCCHWYSCGQCFTRTLEIARQQAGRDADVVFICPVCHNNIEAVVIVDGERQISK